MIRKSFRYPFPRWLIRTIIAHRKLSEIWTKDCTTNIASYLRIMQIYLISIIVATCLIGNDVWLLSLECNDNVWSRIVVGIYYSNIPIPARFFSGQRSSTCSAPPKSPPETFSLQEQSGCNISFYRWDLLIFLSAMMRLSALARFFVCFWWVIRHFSLGFGNLSLCALFFQFPCGFLYMRCYYKCNQDQ